MEILESKTEENTQFKTYLEGYEFPGWKGTLRQNILKFKNSEED